MRSNIHHVAAAWLHALMLLIVPCEADEKQGCEVAVAALSLPDGSGGLLHWRVGDAPTSPLQLSTRYFSERLKLPGNIISFYQDPVAAGQTEPPPPEPLLTLRIPAGQKLVYIVLWSEADENNQTSWRGSLFSGADWKASSMRVLNACSEPLGLTAGEKRMRLPGGKSVDFHARDWGKAFPVKIFRLEPETRPVFSSTWRVTAGRRELCFIVNRSGAVSLRSLLDLGAPPPAAPPR